MINISSRKLRSETIARINEISGQNVNMCYQCGTCSGACPNAAEMDLIPRQLMRRAQAGLDQDIVKANTAWVCVSCLSCSVRCPRGIDIARVMEAVRLLRLRKNDDYVKLPELGPETIAGLPPIALISSFRKHTA